MKIDNNLFQIKVITMYDLYGQSWCKNTMTLLCVAAKVGAIISADVKLNTVDAQLQLT